MDLIIICHNLSYNHNGSNPTDGICHGSDPRIVPGIMLVIGGIFMPGSPRYLVQQGTRTAWPGARRGLVLFRGPSRNGT